MGKRGPKSKFTDVACPNEACKDYGIAGHGNIMGNGTYQARNTTIRRYICHSCGKAFCDSTNTFYGSVAKTLLMGFTEINRNLGVPLQKYY